MESTNSTGENLGASEVLAGLRFQYEVLSSNHSCQAKGKDRTWCGRSTPRLENWGPYLAQNGSKTFKLVSINCQEVGASQIFDFDLMNDLFSALC